MKTDDSTDQNCTMCGEFIPGKKWNQKYCKPCSKIAKKLSNIRSDIKKLMG